MIFAITKDENLTMIHFNVIEETQAGNLWSTTHNRPRNTPAQQHLRE